MNTPEMPPQLGICLSATQHLDDAAPRQTLEKPNHRLMKKRWMEAGVFGKAVTTARPDIYRHNTSTLLQSQRKTSPTGSAAWKG